MALDAKSTSTCVLLTGATGFLGKVVLYQLLRDRAALGLSCVYVLIRKKRRLEVAERFANMVASPCFADLPADWHTLVHPVSGNLSSPGCELSAQDTARLAASVTHIIHCAASVDFDLPIAQACDANITGSLNTLELAHRCQALRRMVSVSTAYVTPHRSGPLHEVLAPLPRPAADLYADGQSGARSKQDLLAETGHPNTYTLTKCIAEHLLLQRRGHVPLSIVRPSIISAAHKTPFAGWIDSDAALAGFVASIGSGYMHVINADSQCLLDVVPVDEVSRQVVNAAFAPGAAADGAHGQRGAATISHAVASIPNACSIQTWVHSIVSFFGRYPGERRAVVRHIGASGKLFNLRRTLHHVAPTLAASTFLRLQGKRQPARQARRLLQRLDLINTVFPYFTHRTFDFRSSASLPDSFDVTAYVQTCCEGVATHLMGRKPREVLFGGSAAKARRSDLLWAAAQPHGNVAIRLCAAGLSKVLQRTFDRVTFDRRSFEEAFARAQAQAGRDGALVLVPTHRSYMDFLVCSYLFFAFPELGIRIPYIAAAQEFSKVRLVGWLFRRMQAFYITRGTGTPDPDLERQVQQLIDQQATLQFFIEGQRSRSRVFLSPHRGLLRCLQGTGKKFVVLPVSISYDRVPEEATFLHELRGHPKQSMQLRGLLGWGRRMLRREVRLGRLHIACGDALLLRPDDDVRPFGRRVMAQLQRHTVVTHYHLHAFVQANPKAHLDPAMLGQAIEARGGKVLHSLARPPAAGGIDPVLERTLRNQWAYLFLAEVCRAQPHNLALAHYAQETLFWRPELSPTAPAQATTPHRRQPLAVLPKASTTPPDEGLPNLVQLLFEPICLDYRAVICALRDFAGQPGPLSASQCLRHAAFQDHTTALSALRAAEAARLLQRSGRDQYTVVGKAADFEAFAAQCAWAPAAATAASEQKNRRLRPWPRAVTA
jgi:fatty acyl-CoA reductase